VAGPQIARAADVRTLTLIPQHAPVVSKYCFTESISLPPVVDAISFRRFCGSVASSTLPRPAAAAMPPAASSESPESVPSKATAGSAVVSAAATSRDASTRRCGCACATALGRAAATGVRELN